MARRYKEREGHAGALDLMVNYCDAFKVYNFVEGLNKKGRPTYNGAFLLPPP